MSSPQSLAELSDAELFAQFEAGGLPAALGFHHADHVRVGWLYVRHFGMPEALARFANALRRFAMQRGAPGLYHETITWAYLLLIAEREAQKPAGSFADFAAANPELLSWQPSVLARYYRPATLDSALARRQFVLPDKLPG